MGTPNYEIRNANGGMMNRLFQNLPKSFNPDPKPQIALTLIQNGTSKYHYLSVKDGVLYFHSQPLGTTGYKPEVSWNLTQVSLGALATSITNGGYGYTAMVNGTQDGSTAALLLGFTNFAPVLYDTVQLQIATSRLWKFLHPIASMLKETSDDGDSADNMQYRDYAKGFWLNFWGDWLNLQRPPGMTDAQYIAYLMWSFRVPKVENVSMAEIITAHYGAPSRVVDSGLYTFTVSIDAGLTGKTPDVASVVNKIKGAGLQWTLDYFNTGGENYEAAFFNRNGKPMANTDLFRPTIGPKENAFGYEQFNGFALGGNMLGGKLNDTSLGFGRTLKDLVNMGLAFYEQSYSLQDGFIVGTSVLDTDPLGGGRKKLTDTLSIINPQWNPSASYRDDYLATKGTSFSNADALAAPQIGNKELQYGVQKFTGFKLNTGQLNDTPVGGVASNSLKDAATMGLSPHYMEPQMYQRTETTWFKFGSGKLNDNVMPSTKATFASSKLSMNMNPTETYRGNAQEKTLALSITQKEAKYAVQRTTGFRMNAGRLNDDAMGGATGLKDAYTLSVATAYSERANIKKGTVLMFGTSGGNLLATLNDTGFSSRQQEAVVMYYNSPTDPSLTLM